MSPYGEFVTAQSYEVEEEIAVAAMDYFNMEKRKQMNRQEIEHIIQESHFQKIILEEEFYFLKGQQALKKWLELEVTNQMRENLIRLSSAYKQFLETAEIDPEIEKIKDRMFEIIAYCDNRAKDKSKYNQYDDDRILADASVRMGNWVEGLVKFKFKHAEITGKSILNAFNYLLSPQDNCTILSDNHRQMVSENLLKKDYSPASFIQDLKGFFDQYELKLQNQDNYTYLISSLVYAFRTEWIEEVIGLMASDGTGWQENATILESKYEGLIVWNSKKPSGGQKTLNFLKEKIKDGQSFPLYYSVKGAVQYKANIVDFAVSQEELSEKRWEDKKIKGYCPDFEDYNNGNKKAYIVFVAESMEEISPKPLSDFKFFGNYSKPTQDNLSPIKEVENAELVLNPKAKMSKNTTPLNQILFGPPGTGKTYHTINEALEITGVDISGLSRAQMKQEFDQKMKEGQIVFTTFHQSMSYEEFIEGIKPIEPEKDGDEVVYRVEPGLFKKLSETALEALDTAEGKNYVLIIDEINRGNVSQIFGELITLIEEDKRFGNAEALEVSLPYSKNKQFSVPPNLYIIGTMNTADRSVEALDTALRRRFSFREMPPKPALLEPSLMLQRLWIKHEKSPWSDPQWVKEEKDFLTLSGAVISDKEEYKSLESEEDLENLSEKFKGVVEFRGIDLSEILKTINGRIEKLLDRDHLIGHSYLIRVNSWEDLQASFYRNIIPLLQEYFFGDYAKIGAVLGSGFVHIEKESNQITFAEGFDNEDFAERDIYQIIDYRPNQPGQAYIQAGMTFEKAIRLLMNQASGE